MFGRSLDLESSRPHPFANCRRCPTCGTCLLAAERDRIIAALPEPGAGWSRYREHEIDRLHGESDFRELVVGLADALLYYRG